MIRVLLIPVFALLVACGPGPVTATVDAFPGMVVGAFVKVQSKAAQSALVVYGPTTDYGSETAPVALENGSATIPVYGLPPSTHMHFLVIGYATNGQVWQTGDITLKTGAMPPIPLPTLTKSGGEGPLGIGLYWNAADGSPLSATVLMDSAGKLLWYDYPGGSTQSYFLEQLQSGHIIQWAGPYMDMLSPQMASQARFVESDFAGNSIHSWADTVPDFIATSMDVVATQTGNEAILGNADQVDPNTPWGQAILGGTDIVFGDSIDEIAPDGSVAFHWMSWPEVTGAESSDGTTAGQLNTLHANSLDVFPNGDYLISFHNSSSVMRVDRTKAQIAWRLGGTNSNFQFVNDPIGGFGKQHDARLLPNGNVTMMDNVGLPGLSDGVATSRAVEYQLDETVGIATLVWSYSLPAGTNSASVGSVRRLPNGDTLIAFGLLGLIRQVNQSGEVVMEMQTPTINGNVASIYRAVPLAGF